MSRRMFSPNIVESDAFLEMPVSTQCLYFHLGMSADDDGFVNPKKIMRIIGASEDDLKVLLAKRFLLPFESGVVVIKHWLIHNLIRADLYKETMYKKEKESLGLNENGSYTELRDGINEIKKVEAPKWLKIRRKDERTANVPQTALRIGKDRLGKVRIGKNTTAVKTAEDLYDFQKEMEKLKLNERKDYKIIHLYWKKKEFNFENQVQFNRNLRRELRPAGDLKGYSGEQILRSINYCMKNYPVWSLETVFKRIADLTNKKK